MIALTLAGNSSRFFEKGYKITKYKLPIGKKTIVESILEFLPKESKILLIINRKFNDLVFFENLCLNMGFKDFKVIELDDTRGQLDTLAKGLNKAQGFYKLNEPLVVYNGDTIRKNLNWKEFPGHGYIEVFISDGDHWSFVDKLGRVSIVTEKKRISTYCSSGLYYFISVEILINNIESYIETMKDEIYIAPFYNYLISKGLVIRSGLVSKRKFIFCGTPKEYEYSLSKFIIKNQGDVESV